MKKVYLSIFGIATALISIAQKNSQLYNFNTAERKGNVFETKRPSTNQVKKKTGSVEKSLTALWSEDFTSTGPLTTANGVWSTSGANGSYWTFATTHPWSANGWTVGLTGSFLEWDSYTPNANETNFSTTPVDGSFTSPNIDLSGLTGGAMITFKTESMYCCNADEFPYFISVSEDGGTTWSSPINFNFDVDRNVATEEIHKPMNVTLDLSAVTTAASNQTKIRFTWTGINADANGQINTHYWWMIDDIKIYDKLNYDLSTEKLWLNDIVTGYEHTEIPKNLTGNLTVQAKIKNYGKLIPTNVKGIVKVLDANGNVVASDSGGVQTNNFISDTDTITFASNINLADAQFAIGSYKVAFEISYDEIDENTENDTLSRGLNITDFYLGQEIFEQSIGIESIGQDFSTVATESVPMTFGNVMSIPSTVTTIDIHGLEIQYAKNTSYSVTEGELLVNFYEIDPAATSFQSSFVDLGINKFYTITAQDLPTANNSIKTKLLNFHQPSSGDAGSVTLEGGKNYIVSVNHTGGSNFFTYVVNSTDDDFSSCIYGNFGSTPGDRWFVNGKQILMRWNFDETLGVNENKSDISVASVYPNPTSGETNIQFNVANASDVTLNVRDLTGKLVQSSQNSIQKSGFNKISFDASSFNSGVYYITLSTENGIVTKKFIKK